MQEYYSILSIKRREGKWYDNKLRAERKLELKLKCSSSDATECNSDVGRNVADMKSPLIRLCVVTCLHCCVQSEHIISPLRGPHDKR